MANRVTELIIFCHNPFKSHNTKRMNTKKDRNNYVYFWPNFALIDWIFHFDGNFFRVNSFVQLFAFISIPGISQSRFVDTLDTFNNDFVFDFDFLFIHSSEWVNSICEWFFFCVSHRYGFIDCWHAMFADVCTLTRTDLHYNRINTYFLWQSPNRPWNAMQLGSFDFWRYRKASQRTTHSSTSCVNIGTWDRRPYTLCAYWMCLGCVWSI